MSFGGYSRFAITDRFEYFIVNFCVSFSYRISITSYDNDELQHEKAFPPMLVTLSGIVMLFKLLQPVKALAPILFMLSGIVIVAKLSQ